MEQLYKRMQEIIDRIDHVILKKTDASLALSDVAKEFGYSEFWFFQKIQRNIRYAIPRLFAIP